jgi:hypothetical protein
MQELEVFGKNKIKTYITHFIIIYYHINTTTFKTIVKLPNLLL